jgi:hypothetical protein
MFRSLFNFAFGRKPKEAFNSKVPEMSVRCQLLIGTCGGPTECSCIRPGDCEFTEAERLELTGHPKVLEARALNLHWRDAEKE